jgi:hypothetical protein
MTSTRKSLLNAKTVEALKPSGKQTIYWDTIVKNFGVRISARGKKAWVLVYRHNRRQRCLTLGHYPDVSLADARVLAEAARGELAIGKDPAAPKDAAARSGTFAELASHYLEKHAKPKKRSWRDDYSMIHSEFLPAWKPR